MFIIIWMRRAFQLGGISVLMVVIASIGWWALHSMPEEGPVIFRFVRATNYNDRTYALFAISNRFDQDLRGYTFPITAGPDGWRATRSSAKDICWKGQQAIWIASAQRPPVVPANRQRFGQQPRIRNPGCDARVRRT